MSEPFLRRIEQFHDIIVMPILHRNHWLLGVVSLQQKGLCVLYIADSLVSRSIERKQSYMKPFAKLVEELYATRCIAETRVRYVNVLQQANPYQCGVHVIRNAAALVNVLEDDGKINKGHQLNLSATEYEKTRKDMFAFLNMNFKLGNTCHSIYLLATWA